MSVPRPKKATPEMRRAAADIIIADLVKDGHLESAEAAACAADLAAVTAYHMDGYGIAKELDGRFRWSCNLGMAEVLDGFPLAIRAEVEKAEKAWFEAESPQMPVPLGSAVEFTWGGLFHTGVVESVYAFGTAQFAVKVDGDAAAEAPSNRRAIINWEDVRSCPTDATGGAE